MAAHAARFAHGLDDSLIESRHHGRWTIGEAGLSLIVHVVLISAAIVVAPKAGEKLREVAPEAIAFLRPAPQPPPPPPAIEQPAPPPPNAVVTPPVVKGFQVLAAPVTIPDRIPDVDLSRAVTNEADFSGVGVAGGIASGVEGGVPMAKQEAPAGDQVYFEAQVERSVIPRDGNPAPVYPDHMRQAGIEGLVLAQFVVDTSGRVEKGSFTVLESTHVGFTDAVRNVLPKLRFVPATIGSRKVRILVQQPFSFSLLK